MMPLGTCLAVWRQHLVLRTAISAVPLRGQGSGDTIEWGDGSWLLPDRRYCNPLGWLAITKSAFSHTGMTMSSPDIVIEKDGRETHTRDGPEKKSGVWFAKMTLCLNANCTTSNVKCAPKKCYATEVGGCVQFNISIFPSRPYSQSYWQTPQTASLFATGKYVECGETAQVASTSTIAGN